MTPQAEPKDDFKVQRVASVLRHSVTESIRNAILVGRFRAGERLPERELCEMTGVSRTLVREALRQLESEGLIIVIPHRGPVVERLSPEQARGIYQVREELEGLACQLFAEHATEAQLAALREAFQGLKRALTRGTALEQIAAKNAFYQQLLDGAGNEALTNTLRLLNSRVMLLRSTSMQAPGRAKHSVAELSDLLRALEKRDGKAARVAGSLHVRNAASVAIGILQESLLTEAAD
ncbi:MULTISPECIES: GntR family transcriptional regulator [Achromobacter]|nr:MULTISPECIES: GntR family transcriptional regulator [Achromobacter]MDF3847595.1 GntR family transcriptional regulator [Achromobacter denitrificans]MDF3858544.1 GntR family transcriptional regulator [Achromobacter denitrificans]MDF3944376.1 GntR family transcriptional regulator [Achromobacter denitrificans]MDX3879500.1 GntR family transcriptional regulator [Achromobacter sp.]OLU03944.1 GntR family transcriptional regulator [Achromobacter denitrificans]